MALNSPGVEISIIDQSQYLPAAPSSVPLIVLATAQNKANAAGTGVAPATVAANANKLYRVTSQRDLVTLYGNPFFYKTTNGTPLQGYELNEYGLLAAYSVLGTTNLCYTIRADIDLAELVGRTGRPSGAPPDGTYWLNTTNSTFGIFEFNQSTGNFTSKIPLVITDSADLEPSPTIGGEPKQSIGNIGDYAVVFITDSNNFTSATDAPDTYATYWYKNMDNTWVAVGSQDWGNSWPTVQGTATPSSLTAGNTFKIGVTTITVPVSPNNTVAGVAGAINSANIPYITAAAVDGKLEIYNGVQTTVEISSLSGTVLTNLGISVGTYYAPAIVYGTNAQQPLWRSTDSQPHPTGSVWFKTNAANVGTSLVVSQYSATADTFTTKSCPLSATDWTITNSIDSTGGQNIPVGTLYCQYDANSETFNAPLQIFRRSATGAAVFVGTNTSPAFIATNTFAVYVSSAGTSSLDGPYTVSITNGDDATDFVTAWSGANIPNTTAAIATTGAIVLTHDEGGVIIMDDGGVANSAVTEAGFELSTPTTGAKWGPYKNLVTTSVALTGGSGTGAVATLTTNGYDVTPTFTNLGRNYAVNDILTAGSYKFKVTAVTNLESSVSGTSIVGAATYTAVATTTTGAGSSATVTVVKTGAGTTYTSSNTTITVVSAGSGYAIGDTITVAGALLGGTTPYNNLTFTVTALTSGGGIAEGGVSTVSWYSGIATPAYAVQMSNWQPLSYIPNLIRPSVYPTTGTNWYYSVIDQVDIMVNLGGVWKGYGNVGYANNGLASATISNSTDPNGPIISATAPTTQSDGTALAYGDLWIDSNDLENYPVISRWQEVNGTDQWVQIDNTDQLTENGIVFADARWGNSDTIDPIYDPLPTIVSLLTSDDYVDLDAPDAQSYPQGTLLFNTRRSGYNVKQFINNYFNATTFPDAVLPQETSAWVSVSGLMSNGAPYMGRKAQRNMIVQALNACVNTNTQIREEDTFFNIMAAPNYPELQPALITLNNDRSQTAYIVGDTPMRLADDANAIVAWATNEAGATSTGEEGLVSRNTYLGLYYPSGITTDLTGSEVAVPSSHMILRTMIYNDTVAYPWFAPAGQRRGIVDNATNIGYIDGATGEFVTTKNRVALRDVEYTNFINPIAYFTNIGLLNYGNKNSFDSSSALDRTNVARLVCYLRWNLQIALRPFIFEPNDGITRAQAKGVVQTLLADIQSKRGVYDYIVVCDDSNNTPARIDRNELWVDVAIEPTKAAEFIYVPVRILNTGEIAGLGQNG